MDCTNAELFNALTYKTRLEGFLHSGILEEEIDRFIGMLEFSKEANFTEACSIARALIIQEGYVDMSSGITSLQWQFLARQVLDQIQSRGSHLKELMETQPENEVEQHLRILDVVQNYRNNRKGWEKEHAPALAS